MVRFDNNYLGYIDQVIDKALSIQEYLYRRQYPSERELLGSIREMFDCEKFLTTSIQ